MTREEVIHDLEAIKEYFEEQTKGSYPLCLSEAIRILQEAGSGKGGQNEH